MMRSTRLQLLVTLAATALTAAFFLHRGLPPDRDLWSAARGENLDQLGRVLRWGAPARSIKVARGTITPIQCLMGSDSGEVVAFLFVHNAFAEEDLAMPPLCHAAEHGLTEMVALLIECGADVNVRDKDNRTPLYYALSEGYQPIADLLRQHGATE